MIPQWSAANVNCTVENRVVPLGEAPPTIRPGSDPPRLDSAREGTDGIDWAQPSPPTACYLKGLRRLSSTQYGVELAAALSGGITSHVPPGRALYAIPLTSTRPRGRVRPRPPALRPIVPPALVVLAAPEVGPPAAFGPVDVAPQRVSCARRGADRDQPRGLQEQQVADRVVF